QAVDDTAAREWCERVLSAQFVLTRPAEVFVPPPHATSAMDLLMVRQKVDGPSAQPGGMLRFVLPRTVLLEALTSPGEVYPMEVVADSSPVELLVRGMASETKRSVMCDEIQECLAHVDKEVIARLDEGQGRDLFISTKQFYVEDLHPLWVPGMDVWLQTVHASAFPEDSPVRKWSPETLYVNGTARGPLVVLGRQRLMFGVSQQGPPRPYYSLALAEWLTKTLRIKQLQRTL